jgi:hypothetical protein
MEPSKTDPKNLTAARFMETLKSIESGAEPDPLIALFSDDAQLVNLTKQHLHYPDTSENLPLTAALFWKNYLRAFDHIETHFTNVITAGDGRAVVLEWRAVGSLPNALPIEFNGISILELEAVDSQKAQPLIEKLKIYYDSAAFLPHARRGEKNFSESVGLPEITNQATS